VAAREIKIIVDNHTGCEFSVDGEWLMGSGSFVTAVDRFHSSAVLHFRAPMSEPLGGAVRFWERLSVGERRRRKLFAAAKAKGNEAVESGRGVRGSKNAVDMDPATGGTYVQYL